MLKYPNFWQNPSILSLILSPFSYIYLFLGWLRKYFAQEIKFPAYVICVGNILVGGAGKTPTIIWLAKFLKARNISFCIVSKGYKGSYKNALIVDKNIHTVSLIGDEAFELSEYGSVIVARNPEYATPLISRLSPKVILFDDGMQNPSFHKDLKILVFDSLRGLGNEKILPAGPLRESKDAAARVDIIISIGPSNDLLKDIQNLPPIFHGDFILSNDLDLTKKYVAFSAIGNNSKFFRTLKVGGINVVRTAEFPDHYFYTEGDLENLSLEAQNLGARLITTAKDYTKIPQEYKVFIDCAHVELQIKPSKQIEDLLDEKVINQVQVSN